MKAIINGKILLPNRIVEGKALTFDGRVTGLCAPEDARGAELIDARGLFVAPGLVDMHMHGYLGEDISDGRAEGLKTIAEGIVKNGVTSFLPTTMTISYEDLDKSFQAVREMMARGKKDDWAGAEVLGVNAEGPFINAKKKGAQNETHVKVCDPVFIDKNSDIIRVFTVAPEVRGNMRAIREIRRSHPEILISIGHTGADYEQAKRAADAGVRHTTHLFNAQTPMMHRDPGVVGCALSDDRMSVELIADTFHVHPALFKVVSRMKGDKLCLITDCVRAGGMPDGEYTLGGLPIFLKGIECRLADGTIAGSVLRLNEAVRNMKKHNGRLPLYKIVNMASLNPACVIGVSDRKGSLEPGRDADILLADADFNIRQTIIKGKTVYMA